MNLTKKNCTRKGTQLQIIQHQPTDFNWNRSQVYSALEINATQNLHVLNELRLKAFVS